MNDTTLTELLSKLPEGDRKKAENLIKLEEEGADLGVYEELCKINESLAKISEKEMPKMEMPDTHKVEIMGAEVLTIKGDKGDIPTDEHLTELITPLIPEPIVGPKGDKGDAIVGPIGPIGISGKDGESIIGPAGKDGKDGSPDTADQIADKINTLEEAIELETIKGLKAKLSDLEKKWTSRPMFGGGGFSKMAMLQYFVDDETPTNSGDDLNFTISHAPSPTSSLKVYRNGQRLKIGALNDYTFSGYTITLLTALGASEILTVDYKI